VCGVDGALKIIDKKSGMFTFTCSPENAAAGTCHPTWERRYKMPTFAHKFASEGTEPPEMERVNLDAANFETLLSGSLSQNVAETIAGRETIKGRTPFTQGRTSDGKSVMHVAVTLPAQATSSLKQTVNHFPQQWKTDPEFLTVRREPARQEMERRLLPSIKMLLKSDASLATAKDKSGLTALHNAVVAGSINMSEALIHSNADVDAQNDEGQTPLMMAVIYGSPDIADLLIRHGADKELQDNYGASFVDYISSSGSGIFPKDAKERFNIDVRPPLKEKPQEHPDDRPDCEESGGWQGTVPPNNAEDLRCDIDQVTDLTPEKWYKEYFTRGRPVLIRNALALSERCGMSRPAVMRNPVFGREQQLGVGKPKHGQKETESMSGEGATIRCGATAYPSITRQKRCPQLCTVGSLDSGTDCVDELNEATGKERKYKPITVVVPPGGKSFKKANWKDLVSARYHHDYFPSYKQVCPVFYRHVKHQLFMGGKEAGATMHFHTHAYNMLFFGYKKWQLLPPRYTEMSGMPAREYMKDAEARGITPYECTQRPGDLMIVPRMYGHATLNEYGFAMGIGSLFVDQNTEIAYIAHHEKEGLKNSESLHKAKRERDENNPETGFADHLKAPYPAWAAAPWSQNSMKQKAGATVESAGNPWARKGPRKGGRPQH